DAIGMFEFETNKTTKQNGLRFFCLCCWREEEVDCPRSRRPRPSTRIPAQSDLQRRLRGLIPIDLAHRLSSLRNQIVLVAEDTGGSAIPELRRALEEYLSVLIGLTKKEYGLEGSEACVANSWFEVLSVVHLMAVLTLSEADILMIPHDHSGSGLRTVSSDCKRVAVDLLLKASGYLEFCVRDVLIRIPPEIKKKLPNNLHDGVLEAISFQSLGQGTEIQLGLAVDCQKATLSVKRRLACEQLTYFSQAYHCLSGCDINNGCGKKHMWFIKWKFLESKAAAYYYHGLILDKGNEPSCHVSAAPPLWGAMRHLHQKIPEVATRKSQMYGYLLEQEKALQTLPDLPEFQLSLRPDDYQLPEMDPAWDAEKWETEGQTLKEHLKDSEDETETE
ncbi:Endosomal targeting BRO1-like domain-containing protein, partial [Prunus dulcis]